MGRSRPRVRASLLPFLVAASSCLAVAAGCGASDPDAGPTDAGTRPVDPDAALREDAGKGDAMTGALDVGPGPVTCAQLGFQASGASCGSSCGSVSCTCPGAWPKSLASCTRDGCLVGVDCTALCAKDLGEALACTDVYAIRPRSDGGSADAASDAALPRTPNGQPCSDDDACASGRCTVQGATGTCVAGVVGDACTDARDCLSALCTAQTCGTWAPIRGGRVAKSLVTVSDVRALADGYTVAGSGMSVDFGTGAADNGRMLYLAEYAHDGAFRSAVWAKVGNHSEALQGAKAADGSRRLAGDFYTSWTVETTQLAPAYAGNFELFAARFGADGKLGWAKRFGAAMHQTQRVEALAVDPMGASYLTGAGKDLDFGSGAQAGAPYLLKLTAAGEVAWAKTSTAQDAKGQGLALDPGDGAVIVSGINGGLESLKLDGTNTTLQGLGIFLARFSASGAHLWSKGFESFGPSARVAVGSDGSIVMAGSFRTRTSFGGETFMDRGQEDVFVAKYTAQGEHVWSRTFGGPKTDRALAVAIDADGQIAVGGLFTEIADFGAGPVRSAGEWDGFVARLDASGTLRALRVVQGPQADEVRSLAFGPQGLLVGGVFSGTQDLGSGPVSAGPGFVMLLPR